MPEGVVQAMPVDGIHPTVLGMLFGAHVLQYSYCVADSYCSPGTQIDAIRVRYGDGDGKRSFFVCLISGTNYY